MEIIERISNLDKNKNKIVNITKNGNLFLVRISIEDKYMEYYDFFTSCIDTVDYEYNPKTGVKFFDEDFPERSYELFFSNDFRVLAIEPLKFQYIIYLLPEILELEPVNFNSKYL